MGNPEGIPRVGKVFTASIDRIDRSGNGIIETRDAEINVGPVVGDAVGEHLDALKLPDGYAICKRKSLRAAGYNTIINKKFGFHHTLDTTHPGWSKTQSWLDNHRQKNKTDSKYQLKRYVDRSLQDETDDQEQTTITIGETYEITIGRISKSGNGIVQISGRDINIGPVKEDAVGKEVKVKIVNGQFAIVLDDFAKIDSYYQNHPAGAEKMSESAVPTRKKSSREPNMKKGVEDSTSQPSSEIDRNSLNHNSINTLREKAENAAVEKVEQTTTSQKTMPQYSRSSHIRKYILARANGACEGCGDPAPFESKTGKPYLHAHHVHELCNGGSDTPDTVIALCPNCHYRVHHGEDGEEYNDELIDILDRKED